MVFDCEHQAAKCQLDILNELWVAVMEGRMEITVFPTPHDFRYVYVDKVSKSYDKPVANVDAANYLINIIKSKL